MREIKFNTSNPSGVQRGLNGWFSGFCPSNGIANAKNKQANSTIAEKKEWQNKYNSLRNGQQASEWGDLKNEVTRLEKLIQEEKITLQQEKDVADALGLGAWCNGAVSKRKRAEAALSAAQRALGIVKGSYQTLERQQKEGIKRASEVIVVNKKTLESIKQQVQVVKQKVADYKVKRDEEKLAKEAQAAADLNSEKKINTASFLSKENTPLIIGGIAIVGAVVYFTNKNKKQKRKRNIKKVKA